MSDDNSGSRKPIQGELFSGIHAASDAASARLSAAKTRTQPLELSAEEFAALRDDFRNMAVARHLPLDLRLVSGAVHVVRTNRVPPRSGKPANTMSPDEIGAFAEAFSVSRFKT